MRDLFGEPLPLTRQRRSALLDYLGQVLYGQVEASGAGIRPPLDLDPADLGAELSRFKTWFDPTAKGARVRSEIAKLPLGGPVAAGVSSELVLEVGDGRRLLSPEGYLLMWLLGRARTPGDGDVVVSESDRDVALDALLRLYRGWSRRRIDDVVGLLGSETSTLRPAAAGLLLTLLVNRNTAPDRALTRPRNPGALDQVSSAVSAPALAYAETLGGRKTSASSVDLYRGWALGELRRRLGPGFHSNLDEGIWLDSTAVDEALDRLAGDVRRRDERGRSRVLPAFDAAVSVYEAGRSKLAALNLSFDQPGNTLRIRQVLEDAVSAGRAE